MEWPGVVVVTRMRDNGDIDCNSNNNSSVDDHNAEIGMN